LAIRGYGAWALVWQTILQRLVSAVLLWRAVDIKLRVAWSPRHFREVWRYAGPVMLASMMGWAAGQVPRVILGVFLGPTDLGLFAMAARLNDIMVQAAVLPSTAVARVSLRQFATSKRAPEEVRGVLFRICALCFPLFVGVAAVLPAVFHLWLDARWFPAIVPSQLMLLSCMPLVTVNLSAAVLLAFNQQGTDALTSTLQTATIALVVFAAAPFGLLVAVAALALRPLVMLPIQLTALARKCAIPARVVLRAQVVPLVAAALMGVAVWVLRGWLVARCGNALAIVVLGLIGACMYVLLMGVLAPRTVSELAGRIRRSAQST
jgi:O-antigen/teichoic acid export membrane protein